MLIVFKLNKQCSSVRTEPWQALGFTTAGEGGARPGEMGHWTALFEQKPELIVTIPLSLGEKRHVAAAFSRGTHHLHLDPPQTLIRGASEGLV